MHVCANPEIAAAIMAVFYILQMADTLGTNDSCSIWVFLNGSLLWKTWFLLHLKRHRRCVSRLQEPWCTWLACMLRGAYVWLKVVHKIIPWIWGTLWPSNNGPSSSLPVIENSAVTIWLNLYKGIAIHLLMIPSFAWLYSGDKRQDASITELPESVLSLQRRVALVISREDSGSTAERSAEIAVRFSAGMEKQWLKIDSGGLKFQHCQHQRSHRFLDTVRLIYFRCLSSCYRQTILNRTCTSACFM